MANTELPPGVKCDQCEKFHPPIPRGEKCPMAKPKSGEGREIETGQFMKQLRNIVISQIQIKKIKNVEKVFSLVLVEITKFLEAYKE